MPRKTLVALLLALCLISSGVAQGDRKPTTKERIQIASVIHLPAACARVRVATTSRKPKWARVSWTDGGSQCAPLASNGVTIVHKTVGRWRFVTAGSSFRCSELYDEVPRAVVKDLSVKCAKA